MPPQPPLSEEDQFVKTYKPIVNHLSEASFDFGYGGCLFETYGPEFNFVRAQPQNKVWTILDCDGALFIENGLHFVNRLGYLVATLPFPENAQLSYKMDD